MRESDVCLYMKSKCVRWSVRGSTLMVLGQTLAMTTHTPAGDLDPIVNTKRASFFFCSTSIHATRFFPILSIEGRRLVIQTFVQHVG